MQVLRAQTHLWARLGVVPMSAKGITIVGASAGSGKTYYLTEQVTAAIDPRGPAPVPVEGLLAVTYTKKAHAELAGRIRQKLVTAGAYDEAMRLPLAYVGTVHAACLRLLQEFALDAGLSPNVDVVAGDDAQLLRQALESALEPEKRQRIEELARGFQLRFEPRSKRCDWLTPVSDIMDLARGNRIPPSELATMAQRSIEGLLRLFPTKAPAASVLDANLLREMASALETLNVRNDGTAATDKVISTLKECLKRADDRELTWVDWARLSLLTPAKASADGVTRLCEAAVAYERHPRLHAELSELVFAMFDAARAGRAARSSWLRGGR
jgi:ATP-dependent helicase/nuclease subunit A